MFHIRVVSNAGPLIWLSKCEILWLLKKLYGIVYIPNSVLSEVVERGAEEGYSDARLIREAVNELWIRVQPPSKKALSQVRKKETDLGVQLGSGERQAIALARDLQGTVLTNDQLASTVARALGTDTKGVLFVLLLGVQGSLLDKARARHAIQVMLREGFWLSPDVINKFYQALEQIQK